MTDFHKMMDEVYKVEVEELIEKEVRFTALQVLSQLVLITPVDSGRARSNWNTDLNSIDLTLRDPTAIEEVLARGEAATLKFKLNGVINITNNLPYIERLNEGHSKKAPAGFVDSSIEVGVRKAEELSNIK